MDTCKCNKFANCISKEWNIADLDGDDINAYYRHAHKVINASGKFNYEYCKFPVPTHWRLNTFFKLLKDTNYHDLDVIKFLKYGWPIDTCVPCEYSNIPANQRGARDNPEAVKHWLSSELSNRSVIGPLRKSSLVKSIRVSLIDAIPKKDSDERRIILNLSHPDTGQSVNDAVSKNIYLGKCVNLSYPSVDDLVSLIWEFGVGSALMKVDLRRYYRQIFYDPGCIHLVGFSIDSVIYCDVTLSMGLRIACYIAQRVSDAILHIFNNTGKDRAGVNYIDDIAAVARWSVAYRAYNDLVELLTTINIWEAQHKRCPPDVIMTFLGVSVNSISLLLSLTDDRLAEIRQEMRKWLNKSSASRRDIQSLVGKLSFAATTVRSGRLFFSRILNFLRILPKHGIKPIPAEAKKDIKWWSIFIEEYNGISFLPEPFWQAPDAIISSDAALAGLGGFCQGEYFHTSIPQYISEDPEVFINELECLAIVIALKAWAPALCSRNLLLKCDNQTTIAVINRGRAHNSFTQKCLREVAYLASLYSFQIKVEYVPSEENRISDYLSRWELDPSYKERFWEEIALGYDVTKVKQVLISSKHFQFSHPW